MVSPNDFIVTKIKHNELNHNFVKNMTKIETSENKKTT